MEKTTNTQSEFYGISYYLNGEYFILMEKILSENSTTPFAFVVISSPEKIAEYIIQKFSKEKTDLTEHLIAFNSLKPFVVKFNTNSQHEIVKEIFTKYHDGSGQIISIKNDRINHEIHGLKVKPSIIEIKEFSINIEAKKQLNNVQIKNITDDDNIQNQKPWFNPFNPNQQNMA